MKINPKQYAEALIAALDEVPVKQKDVCFDNFMKIISGNNDANKIPLIIDEVKKISDIDLGFKEATITTAISVSADFKKSIVEKLGKKFNSKIKLNSKVDPAILGGTIIEVESEILDKSVSSWISRLKQEINN